MLCLIKANNNRLKLRAHFFLVHKQATAPRTTITDKLPASGECATDINGLRNAKRAAAGKHLNRKGALLLRSNVSMSKSWQKFEICESHLNSRDKKNLGE